MHRKTAGYLNQLRQDVVTSTAVLRDYSEILEDHTFELDTMVQDDVRTDKDGDHTALVKESKTLLRKLSKAMNDHEKAVKLYREYL